MNRHAALTTEEIRRRYDEIAPRYDRNDRLFEATIVGRLRSLFAWAQAEVLEVAIGTGKNLPYYPASSRITSVDVSAGMLAQTRKRAAGIDPASRAGDHRGKARVPRHLPHACGRPGAAP